MNNTQAEILEALQKGKFDLVVNLCKSSNNSSPQILEYHAIAECHLGNMDESKKLFLSAIKKDPHNSNLLYNYSEVLSDLGDLTACNKVLDQIIAGDSLHQAAISKKEEIESLIRRDVRQNKSNAISVNFSLERSENPLQAAFNSEEVNAAKANLKEREKKIRKQKLYQKPQFPDIDKNLLNEERLLAAEDALRAGFPDLALELSSEASAFRVSLHRVYAIAGDAYIALKKYNSAHLCYLIASQQGELDLQRQVNLLSLSNSIGDSQLLESRKDALNQKLGQSSRTHELIEKIISQSKPKQHVVFDPKLGIKPSNQR